MHSWWLLHKYVLAENWVYLEFYTDELSLKIIIIHLIVDSSICSSGYLLLYCTILLSEIQTTGVESCGYFWPSWVVEFQFSQSINLY